jgi:hypothetical protein
MPKYNFAPYIRLLNDEIKKKGINFIKSSITTRNLEYLGNRVYEITFDSFYDGKIPEDSSITLYDPNGYEIEDPLIIRDYLMALTEQIEKNGLSKKDGFFSEPLDKLCYGINFLEDSARQLTKLFINYCVVKPASIIIDSIFNTKIHQNLKDNNYFDFDKQTKGHCRWLDPSKLVSSVCNLAFRPTRVAMKLVDKLTSIFIPINSQSHYLPGVTQSDIDKIKKKSPKSISDSDHETKKMPRDFKKIDVQFEYCYDKPAPYWRPQSVKDERVKFKSQTKPHCSPIAPYTMAPKPKFTQEQLHNLHMGARSAAFGSYQAMPKKRGVGVTKPAITPLGHKRGGGFNGIGGGGGRFL